ncbi:hypothetical protein [Rhizobium leguminosarum]|uniref:hypothetical protein n=1 Tax=Rhizobium leguminosarum TaxID=384 RepID=UPI002E134F90|nr:hypothetical protein U8Q02_36715 [Rhizobium leguminosarum]
MTRIEDRRIQYLAAGLLTQAEAKALVDDLKRDFDLGVVDELFRAFRSMTVAVISSRAPETDLREWSYAIRHVVAALGRQFEGAAEKFLTLRFMLAEAAELADMSGSEEHERQGMKDMLALVKRSWPEGISLVEIEAATGDRPHAIAQRLRLAIASQTVGLAGNWTKRRFITTGLDPQPRTDYPLTGIDEITAKNSL